MLDQDKNVSRRLLIPITLGIVLILALVFFQSDFLSDGPNDVLYEVPKDVSNDVPKDVPINVLNDVPIDKPSDNPQLELELDPNANVFDGAKVQKGDEIAGMTVVDTALSLDKPDAYNPVGTVQFSGKAQISGIFMIENDEELGEIVFFAVDRSSYPSIPMLHNDWRDVRIILDNNAEAKRLFGTEEGGGEATIVIDDYQISFQPGEVYNSAKLVEALQINLSSLSQLQLKIKLYWDEVDHSGSLYFGRTFELPAYEYVWEGLKHESQYIRWYCAYKISEYMDAANKQAISEAMETLLGDDQPMVVAAAKFTNALLHGNYKDDDRFVGSPDGKTYAFNKYDGMKFNDGNVWITENKSAKLIYDTMASIYQLSWSPDSRWLYVEYGGQTWYSFILIDRKTLQAAENFDLITQIISDSSNGYDVDPSKAPRFDPYEGIVEWSPDSSKFMFYYHFSDENYMDHTGFGVYNLKSRTIEKVYKSTDSSPSDRPEGFSW